VVHCCTAKGPEGFNILEMLCFVQVEHKKRSVYSNRAVSWMKVLLKSLLKLLNAVLEYLNFQLSSFQKKFIVYMFCSAAIEKYNS